MADKTIEVTEKRHLPHPKSPKEFFRFYLVNFFFALLILVGLIILSSLTIFQIRSVTVEGNSIVSAYEVQEEIITGDYEKNGLYQWAINFLQPKTDLPFIESYKVSFLSPSKILITVDEVEIYGFIALEDGNYAYFDGDGIVVEVSDRLVEGFLPVSGVTSETACVGEELPIKSRCLTVLLQITKNFKKYGLTADVITFSEDREVYVQSGNIFLDFGSFDYLEEKIMRLQYIMPYLEGQSGTLHLENWTPENTDIIFASDTGEEEAIETEEVPLEEGVTEESVTEEGATEEVPVEETPVEVVPTEGNTTEESVEVEAPVEEQTEAVQTEETL